MCVSVCVCTHIYTSVVSTHVYSHRKQEIILHLLNSLEHLNLLVFLQDEVMSENDSS